MAVDVFVLPLINLAETSTKTPVAGGETGSYEQTFRLQNYVDAFSENSAQFSRSFIYALLATLLALAISYPSLTQLHSKVESIKTYY